MSSQFGGSTRRASASMLVLERRISRLEKALLKLTKNQASASGQVRAQWERARRELEDSSHQA
jgi:hypothetical protein